MAHAYNPFGLACVAARDDPMGVDALTGLTLSDRIRIQADLEEQTPLHLLASRALEQAAIDAAAAGSNVPLLGQSSRMVVSRHAEQTRIDAEASRQAAARLQAVLSGEVSKGPAMAAGNAARAVPAPSAGAESNVSLKGQAMGAASASQAVPPLTASGNIDWEALPLPQRLAVQRRDDTINRRSGISKPQAQEKSVVSTLACNMLEALDPDTDEARQFALRFNGSSGIVWMSTLARTASRQISFCGLPISSLAQRWLEKELHDRRTGNIPWYSWKAYLVDMSSRGESDERIKRTVCALIRHNTYSHAFEETPRRKAPDSQKCNGHSVFRSAAMSFVPSGVSDKALERNQSNHPMAGESRKLAVKQLRSYLTHAGFQMFDTSISSAARDLQATVGERMVYDIKDLMHADPSDKNSHDKVITIVDQDFYIDDMTAFAGQKIVIITREYNKLAGRGPESTYYYSAREREGGHAVCVTERVGDVCGATYTDQRPWDYTANDIVYIQHRGGVGFTTYNVHIQYQPNTLVKFVWLCPQTTCFVAHSCLDGLYVKYFGKKLAGIELRKADNVAYVNVPGAPVADGFIVGMFGTVECPIVSIKFACTVGPGTSIEMSELDYKDFVLMAAGRASGYGLSEVRRVMQRMKIWREGGAEAVVAAYFKIPIAYRPLPNIMYTTAAAGPGAVVEDVSQAGPAVQAAPNIAGGGPGVADVSSDAAFTAYKERRKDAYANKTKVPPGLKKVVDRLLIKFCELVSQETGVEKDSVGLQDRSVIYGKRVGSAAVRLETFNMLNLYKEGNAKTNLKTEVTPKASVAPRGVTQYNEDLAIETGLVGLLVKEILKSTAFYQPGSTPGEIATAVQQVANVASEVHDARSGRQDRYKNSGSHDTDFSKLDETYSEDMYRWFVFFTLYFTLEKDKQRVEGILMDNVNLITMIGSMLAATDWKNNSGSGITTELNTFLCGFEEFVISCIAIAIGEHERCDKKPDFDWTDLTSSKLHKLLETYSTRTISFAVGSGKADLSIAAWMKTHVTGWRTSAEWEAIPAESRAPFSFNNLYQISYFVIGPKFGDDGIGMHLPGVCDRIWSLAADYFTKAIGQVHEGNSTLKVTFNTPEDPYFFLGRYHPAPNISLASYSDVLKAIRKLSVAKNSEKERYILKLHGYWTTDSETPVLSEYLQAVAKMYGVELQMYVPEIEGMCPTGDGGYTKWAWEELDVRQLVNSDSKFAILYRDDRDMFYRVASGVHRGASAEDALLMHEVIARQLDMSSAELTGLRTALKNASTWDEIDAIRISGQDWDPSAEPEGTVRVDGPIKSLLDPQPSSANDATRLAKQRAATGESSHAHKKATGKPSAAGAKLKRLLEDKPAQSSNTGKKSK